MLSVAFAVSMYPDGQLADGLSRKAVLVGSLAVAATGFAGLALAGSYTWFLVGVTAFGLGGGAYWISLRALLADLYTARRGEAFGVQDGLEFIGPVIAAGAAVLVLALATWRAAFPLLIGSLLTIAVLVHRWLRGSYALSWIDFDTLATG